MHVVVIGVRVSHVRAPAHTYNVCVMGSVDRKERGEKLADFQFYEPNNFATPRPRPPTATLFSHSLTYALSLSLRCVEIPQKAATELVHFIC